MNNQANNTCLVMTKDLGMILLNPANKQKVHRAEYQCHCGTLFITNVDRVKRNVTTSCGCYKQQQSKERLKTHGLSKHKLHKIWSSIVQRTSNAESKYFQFYGARNIVICDEWKNDFISFYDWAISNGYSDELSLDRIDNNGNYEPSNCRWTTKIIQAQNRRPLISKNTSGYRGVHWHKIMSAWQARITVNKKRINLGYYKTAYDAHIAYRTYVDDNQLEHNY